MHRGLKRSAGLASGLVLIAALSGALAGPAAAASATELADASCNLPGGDNVDAAGNVRWGETFTAIHSGALTRAQVGVYKTGTPGDFIFSIHATSAGAPVDPPLAVAVVPDSTVPNGFSTADISFPTPASVLAGQQYAISATRPASDTMGVITLTGNQCPSNAFFVAGPGVPWMLSVPDRDVKFAMFVTPPAAGPTGQRNAALTKCKKKAKKHNWSHKKLKKCKKKALLLPV
jgi:hypothetical protein